MAFYEKYLKLCNKSNVAPTVVAENIGLNRSSATGWKKGFKPTDATLAKIADYFGVEISYFGEDDILQSIADEERALLHSYRTMTEEQKQMMKVFIKGLKADGE